MRDWRAAALSELADIRVSNVDKKSFPSERSVRLCNYMDVYANEYVRASLPFMAATASESEILKFRVERGDVLITKDSETPDDIGIPAVVVDDLENVVCGYHIALLKPNQALVDPVYLSKQLGTVETANYFARQAVGSTRYGLSSQAIANTRIQLAPLQHQRRIATVLTCIDDAIEKTEALIDKYQQIKTGLMHDLFTRGVLPSGELRATRGDEPGLYRETSIGWLPRDWQVVELGELAEIVSGITLGAKEDPGETIDAPYLRVANVQDGYLDLADVKTVRISPKTLESLRLLPGDVLMNEGGDFDKLGRGAVWAGEIPDCVHQNHVFRVRTNSSSLLPDFLAFRSQSAFGKKYFVLSSKQSTNLASINSKQLHAYPIALPSASEQKASVVRVHSVNRRLETLHRQSHKLNQQKLGLMQDLLTGKVPVKVDEPVAETADA